MAVRKKRRSKHAGVALLRPSGRHLWRAKFKDPDTGRMVRVSLDAQGIEGEEARIDWCARKSRELAIRRAQLAEGASPVKRTALKDAIDGFFTAVENELRPTTVALYRTAADVFLEWAAARDIAHTSELRAGRLPGFRDYLVGQRARSYTRTSEGRKARRAAGKKKLAAQTHNWKLRAIGRILNWLRTRAQVPLSRDQIRDALQAVKVPGETPEFLTQAEIVKLLEACLRHDSAVHRQTRAESRGERPKGTTQKYAAVAPLVAITLLCGFRFGEATNLRWKSVLLDTLDADGKPAGEILLKAEEVKTNRDRKVMLNVSPSVRKLLAAMRMRSSRDAVYVFGGDEGKEPMTKTLAESSRRRLIAEFGAPSFNWKLLRSTCACYGSAAGGIWGTAAAYSSAKRLGHAVAVADRLYTAVVSVPRDAKSLEAAMGIEEQMTKILERAHGQTCTPQTNVVRLSS